MGKYGIWYYLDVTKCNLGRVNCKPMHPAVSVICGVATRACLAMCLHVSSSHHACRCLLYWSLWMATLDRSLLWSPYLQSTSCLLIDFLLVESNLLNSSPIDELGEGAYDGRGGAKWNVSVEQGTQVFTATQRVAKTHEARSVTLRSVNAAHQHWLYFNWA